MTGAAAPDPWAGPPPAGLPQGYRADVPGYGASPEHPAPYGHPGQAGHPVSAGRPAPPPLPAAGYYAGDGYPAAGYPAAGYPSGGYPAAGYPAAGYPAAGYPAGGYAGGGYPSPPNPGTNGFSIASLIFGIIGGIPLGVVFGCIALSQIRRSGQAGRGLAIAGLVLSGLWTLLVIAGVVAAIAGGAKRDDTGQIAQGGDVSATSLQVGDCVNGLVDTTRLLSLPGVPCVGPHEGEVFAVFDLPAGPYPGEDEVSNQVDAGCNDRLGQYSESAVTDPDVSLFTVYPTSTNWRSNDREVVCIATPLSGTTTGSLRGR